MSTRMLCLFMATSAVLLTACGRDQHELPPTASLEGPAASAPLTTPSVDPSLPTNPPVMQGQANAPQDPASGARVPGATSRTPGAGWTPTAGQNNDHSAPLAASAPSAR